MMLPSLGAVLAEIASHPRKGVAYRKLRKEFGRGLLPTLQHLYNLDLIVAYIPETGSVLRVYATRPAAYRCTRERCGDDA